jgi:hypothetical protein
MATPKIVKPNNEAPDDLEKEVAAVRIELTTLEFNQNSFVNEQIICIVRNTQMKFGRMLPINIYTVRVLVTLTYKLPV